MVHVAKAIDSEEEQKAGEMLQNSEVVIVHDRSSTLYLSHDAKFDRPNFIEVIEMSADHDPGEFYRFHERMKKVAQLQHRNIAAILDVGITAGNKFYTALEHFNCLTLSQKLIELKRARSVHSPLEVLVFVDQIADALGAAHELDIIHQDLRPEKILLTELNKPMLIGLSMLQPPQPEHSLADITPNNELDYEPPEQDLGEELTVASNVYSLGILIYELLAGSKPPLLIGQWADAEVVTRPQTTPIEEIRPGLSRPTYELVQQCIQDEPWHRYQTMKALRMAIHKAIQAEKMLLERKRRSSPLAYPLRSRWTGLLVGLLLLVGLGGGWALLNSRMPVPEPAVVAAAAANNPLKAPTVSPTAVALPTITTDPAATAPGQTAELAAPISSTHETPITAPATNEDAANEPLAEPSNNSAATAATSCAPELSLVAAYPFDDAAYDLSPVGIFFPMNWTLQNSGNCTVAANAQLVYLSGETFGYDNRAILLPQTLPPGEEITLSTTLVAPEEAGSFTSTWQAVDARNNVLSKPFTFQIRTFVPQEESPTPEEAAAETAVDPAARLAWHYNIDSRSCGYAGQDWRCQMSITPTGGSGGPYSVFLFDQPAGQATEKYGYGPFTYHVLARRCLIYMHEVQIRDDASGKIYSEMVYINPNDYFACSVVEQVGNDQ